jgi:hypothetical protein
MEEISHGRATRAVLSAICCLVWLWAAVLMDKMLRIFEAPATRRFWLAGAVRSFDGLALLVVAFSAFTLLMTHRRKADWREAILWLTAMIGASVQYLNMMPRF